MKKLVRIVKGVTTPKVPPVPSRIMPGRPHKDYPVKNAMGTRYGPKHWKSAYRIYVQNGGNVWETARQMGATRETITRWKVAFKWDSRMQRVLEEQMALQDATLAREGARINAEEITRMDDLEDQLLKIYKLAPVKSAESAVRIIMALSERRMELRKRQREENKKQEDTDTKTPRRAGRVHIENTQINMLVSQKEQEIRTLAKKMGIPFTDIEAVVVDQPEDKKHE